MTTSTVDMPLSFAKEGNPFAIDGASWFRGNTHTHSTASDGQLTVPQLAEWYGQNGYDFLCITDHNVVAEFDPSAFGSVVLIPGAEIGVCWDGALAGEVCALGIEAVRRKAVHPQLVIDDVREQGGIPVISHPHQSGVYSGLMMELDGLMGIEVFNAYCYGTGRRGFATVHWDDLLTAGKHVWGLASDDRHSSGSGGTGASGCDCAKAWIVVRSQQRTREAILDSISHGWFYATTGPQIIDLRLSGDKIIVKTTPVKSVRLASLPWCGTRVRAEPNEMLTETHIPVDAAGTPARADQMVQSFTRQGFLSKPIQANSYFRIECWDGDEGYAWSNPLFLLARE